MFWLGAGAQAIKVEGTVVTDDGSALPRVSVTVKDTDKGAFTDANGKFTLNVSAGETLVVTYVGYEEKKLVVGKETNLTIRLTPTNDNLKSVVVIGYGTARKRQLVGASTTVSATDAGATIATNPSQLLIGKAAGVQVVNSSGTPGSSSQIVIRGTGSFTSVDPLYV